MRAMLSAGYGVAGQRTSGKGYRPGSYRRTSPQNRRSPLHGALHLHRCAVVSVWQYGGDPASSSSNSIGETRPFQVKILVAKSLKIPHSSTTVRAPKSVGQSGAITPTMGGALMPAIDN